MRIAFWWWRPRRSAWRRERTCGSCCAGTWCDGETDVGEAEGGEREAVALSSWRAGKHGGRLGEESEHANGGSGGICAHETERGAGGARSEESEGESAGSGTDRGDCGLQADSGVDTSLSSVDVDAH